MVSGSSAAFVVGSFVGVGVDEGFGAALDGADGDADAASVPSGLVAASASRPRMVSTVPPATARKKTTADATSAIRRRRVRAGTAGAAPGLRLSIVSSAFSRRGVCRPSSSATRRSTSASTGSGIRPYSVGPGGRILGQASREQIPQPFRHAVQRGLLMHDAEDDRRGRAGAER